MMVENVGELIEHSHPWKSCYCCSRLGILLFDVDCIVL